MLNSNLDAKASASWTFLGAKSGTEPFLIDSSTYNELKILVYVPNSSVHLSIHISSLEVQHISGSNIASGNFLAGIYGSGAVINISNSQIKLVQVYGDTIDNTSTAVLKVYKR